MTPRHRPVHTLFQITDPHLVAEGLLRDRLDTAGALTRALAAVEESGVAPAALVFTGDLTDAGEPAAYRRLRELVEPVAARVGAPAVYVVGNHDRRAALRQHLLDGSRPAGSGTDEPYDHVVRVGGLRIVVLDTSVPGQAHGDLDPDQLAWLAAELTEPAPDGTVLALHHPPLPSPSPISSALALVDPGPLAAVLAHSDVRIVLAGHTHVVSAGALAGIPVWTGGATAYASDPLPPAGTARGSATATVSRIDLFADSLIVTAVPLDTEPLFALTAAQLDAMVAGLEQR